MAKILPARGLYYNPQKITDLSLVSTPPYDVISPEEERRYRERNPYNVIRLILPTGKGGEIDIKRPHTTCGNGRRKVYS